MCFDGKLFVFCPKALYFKNDNMTKRYSSVCNVNKNYKKSMGKKEPVDEKSITHFVIANIRNPHIMYFCCNSTIGRVHYNGHGWLCGLLVIFYVENYGLYPYFPFESI